MTVQALYLRWRPMTFEEVVGQEHVTYTLRNALISGRIGHAYLFSGPRGTGKTTLARLLAKAVNCLHDDPAMRPCNACRHCVAVNEGRFLDLIEIDAASHTSVEDVRELRDRIAFAPNEGRYKVYIIDEVHRFSGAAFDALLKTLEEPPAHALFVLATTEVHKVPQTILSRCQRFDFRRIPLGQIVERLRLILQSEGIQYEETALELVARQATGSLRDAISLLDQLIAEPGQVLTLELAQAILGTAASQTVGDLTDALLDGDVARGLSLINWALDQGVDPRQLSRQMVEYLRIVMLIQSGGEGLVETLVGPEALVRAAQQATRFPRRALLAALEAFNTAATDARGGWQPQLPLEIALLNSAEALYSTADETPVATPPPPPAVPARPAARSEPPPAQEPSPLPPETASASLTLADIHARWQEVLQVARQVDPSGMIQALLRSGRLQAVLGNVIVMQMSGDVLCDKIESEENRQMIEATLQRVFNQPLTVRCRVPAGSRGNQQSSEVDRLLAEDSLASYAINELGGHIREIKDTEE